MFLEIWKDEGDELYQTRFHTTYPENTESVVIEVTSDEVEFIKNFMRQSVMGRGWAETLLGLLVHVYQQAEVNHDEFHSIFSSGAALRLMTGDVSPIIPETSDAIVDDFMSGDEP